MTITEFLLARIAEDERMAKVTGEAGGIRLPFNLVPPGPFDPARVLAECESKRRIVEDVEWLDRDYKVTHDPITEARRLQAMVAAGWLASAYIDHPDYDEAWRP